MDFIDKINDAIKEGNLDEIANLRKYGRPKQSEESDYEEKFQLTEADQEWLNGGGPFGPFGGNGNEHRNNGKSKSKKENKETEEKPKRHFLVYKYSNRGKLPLHEAIILGGKPCFIHNDEKSKSFITVETIDEETRVLRPPSPEEYPYTPCDFKDKAELDSFFEQASKISIAQLYRICKEHFQRFVDQDDEIIVLLSSDAILTYFQDLFPAVHYVEGVGGNDVGKSSIGYTFEYTGYRVIRGSSISGPNYYRVLGTVEPGQCVIIEDEGDSISEDADKVRILKSGYEYNAKIPKTNANSVKQEQNWFYTFCYKMILAEKSLSQYKAKGLVDRTFTIKCMSGKVEYSIKSVVSDTINKNAKLKELCRELLDFRKLMLCYRLIHYKDELPDIVTNLLNRDLELTEPILQLFYGTECFDETKQALEFFIAQRRGRKISSLEAILYKIVQVFVDNFQTPSKYVTIQYCNIWSMITNGEIAGTYNPSKPNEYETTNHGTIYNNTLSKIIEDQFGATLDKNNKGSVVKIDVEKFRKVENTYSNNNDVQRFKIKVWLKGHSEDEDTQEKRKSDGCDGCDGSSDGMGNENKPNDDSNIENQRQNDTENSDNDNENSTSLLTHTPLNFTIKKRAFNPLEIFFAVLYASNFLNSFPLI